MLWHKRSIEYKDDWVGNQDGHVTKRDLTWTNRIYNVPNELWASRCSRPMDNTRVTWTKTKSECQNGERCRVRRRPAFQMTWNSFLKNIFRMFYLRSDKNEQNSRVKCIFWQSLWLAMTRLSSRLTRLALPEHQRLVFWVISAFDNTFCVKCVEQ